MPTAAEWRARVGYSNDREQSHPVDAGQNATVRDEYN